MTPSAETTAQTQDDGIAAEVPSKLKPLANGFHTLEGGNGADTEDAKPTALLPSLARFLEAIIARAGDLFSSSAEAKIWNVASAALSQPEPPRFYPEYTKPGGIEYVYRDLQFWTSGFFPGSLYLLLERRKKYPGLARETGPHTLQLEHACNWWTENLHENASLTGTHDLGFMIFPWASLAWQLNGDERALQTMNVAAETLHARFNDKIGLMRSWDKCETKKYSFTDPESEFLVIIDNMMNLSLLFSVAEQTGNAAMREAAITHARTTAKTHIRPDNSTTHLVVLCPATGETRQRLTNQGLRHDSCWARGQAWAIAGFAKTHRWTRMGEFLDVARRCADYFLDRLPPSGIAPWDFDAAEQEQETEKKRSDAVGEQPREPQPQPQPPDTSATLIAAYGMLLIHRALLARGQASPYLAAALRFVDAVCTRHLNPRARYRGEEKEIDTVELGKTRVSAGVGVENAGGETIVDGATINNYEFAPRRWADHGLVYADYYFLLFGNELLRLDVGSILQV